MRPLLVLALGLGLGLVGHTALAEGGGDIVIDASQWRLVTKQSGPVNYYTVSKDPAGSYVKARYVPPVKTAVVGYQVADADRQRIKKVRWTWRAVTLPNGGDECASGKGDSAAVVYVTWKRGLKYYTLKYVWSAVGAKGQTACDRKRNPFVAQDTIILESGGPLDTWKTEEIDLANEFRNHFEGGDKNADVPDFVGLGLMSDGDQTNSPSAADYGTFTLIR